MVKHPATTPEFAAFLVEAGIDSISLNPDSVISVTQHVANAEKKGMEGRRPQRSLATE